jgi:hypothetical protein
MKKLYCASYNVCFVSDDSTLKEDADRYVKDNYKWNRFSGLQIKEIVFKEDIPDIWNESILIWGIEEEMTAAQFLDRHINRANSVEYQEYVRLKKKFEV